MYPDIWPLLLIKAAFIERTRNGNKAASSIGLMQNKNKKLAGLYHFHSMHASLAARNENRPHTASQTHGNVHRRPEMVFSNLTTTEFFSFFRVCGSHRSIASQTLRIQMLICVVYSFFFVQVENQF